MSNIFSYNGYDFDLDKIKYMKATSKKVSEHMTIPGLTICNEDGSKTTYYGQDFYFGAFGRGYSSSSFTYQVFHNTKFPFAAVGDNLVNLNKVQSVSVGFKQTEGQGEEGTIGVFFKDNSLITVKDEASELAEWTFQDFVNSVEFVMDNTRERNCEKDTSGVSFSINVGSDRSMPVPDGQNANFGTFVLDSVLDFRRPFIPESISFKEVPRAELFEGLGEPLYPHVEVFTDDAMNFIK